MSEIEGIYVVWLREVKRFLRYKSRILTSIVTPLLWLIIFGTGLGMSVKFTNIPGGYRTFIFPGIIAQTILFTSVFSGVSVVIDRQYGFLKEILVSPISRPSIILGKAFGISTASVIQTVILLALSFLVNIEITLTSFVISVILSFIISMGFGGLGLMIAAITESTEGFNLVMSFIVLPIFLLSGALFPITGLPTWLQRAVYANPLTYGVDALRFIILHRSVFPFWINLCIISLFSISMILIASILFDIKEQNLL
ncbi:daunorubicin resistance ABC transporter, inner membrane subunit B [Methanothermus fervidus DSM 2088]|uniref:Daunorubicin resistance ABC transporter, inner membrane subunit B n=1 Tax=Methanothermus fervidus (strain ATCC 43054 / DSM 2088 / JCM 10308 / V24 S) TaxID=523846 RepID=E3GYB6_METFV|nr:ABC transporter permease [Methanothermus fervidus]ADP77298.1 daunorubicin resistance ABC transporter, inner membrane subunit B [Methanothermus fervidus DSM 2088]